MATEVKWIESKTPLDVAIKYFVEFYHSGFQDVEDAKKYYFEMINQNAFDNMYFPFLDFHFDFHCH